MVKSGESRINSRTASLKSFDQGKTIITYATSCLMIGYFDCLRYLYDCFHMPSYFYFNSLAAGAIGASRNLRRFGQSIKRVVREVKDAENLEAAGIKLTKSIAV